MPTYEVQAPDGRTIEIDGPQPPSEAILREIFGKLPAAAAPAPAEERTWTDTAVDLLPMAGGVIGGMAGASAGPLGAVGLAALGGAAGERVKQYANAIRGEEALPDQREALSRMGTEGALQGGSEALGGVVGKVASGTAKAVYRGYLKPSLSKQMAPRANQIVKTALDEALPISRSGQQTADRVVGELRKEVDGILAKSPEKVDLAQIAQSVRAFAKQRYYKPGADMTDFNAAMEVANKLDAHPSLGIPPGATPSRIDVPLSKANDVKRALDTSVKETGFGVTTGSKRTTEKFARHEINTAMRKKAASIAPLNDRESKLIDAAKAIGAAVEREANQNALIGTKTMIAGAVGGGAGYAQSGGDPTTAAAWALAARIGLHPAVATRAAILANRYAKELGVSSASAARLAMAVTTSADGGSDAQGTEP